MSPGKTWEGAVGSVVGGMLAGGSLRALSDPSASLGFALGIWPPPATSRGKLGDLCESALKRGAGVKDSGSCCPATAAGWIASIRACSASQWSTRYCVLSWRANALSGRSPVLRLS